MYISITGGLRFVSRVLSIGFPSLVLSRPLSVGENSRSYVAHTTELITSSKRILRKNASSRVCLDSHRKYKRKGSYTFETKHSVARVGGNKA